MASIEKAVDAVKNGSAQRCICGNAARTVLPFGSNTFFPWRVRNPLLI